MSQETWVNTQHKTFGKWTDRNLQKRGMSINSLREELSDGVKLLNLLEIVSGKKITGWTKVTKLKIQCLENLSLALTFCGTEGIKLVGIGPGDIYDKNVKLILGLMWSIILRFQIQTTDGANMTSLLLWVQEQTKGLYSGSVSNFTRDWSNGQLLSALVMSMCYAPHLSHITDPETLIQKAMEVAEQELHIPSILDAHDMAFAPDDLSTMTYISYFKNAKVPSVVNFKPVNVKTSGVINQTKGVSIPIARADGQEFDHSKLQVFFVRPSSSSRGEPIPFKISDDGQFLNLDVVPESSGEYEIQVDYNEKAALRGITVSVASGISLNLSQFTNFIHQSTDISIPFTNLDDKPIQTSKVNGHILSPDGVKEPLADLEVLDDKIKFTFTPSQLGKYSFECSYDGTTVGSIPLLVSTGIQVLQEKIDPKPILRLPIQPIDGSELSSKKIATFLLHPSGKRTPIPFYQTSDGSIEVPFQPEESGDFQIEVEVDGLLVQPSIKVPVQLGLKPIDMEITGKELNKPSNLCVPFETLDGSALCAKRLGAFLVSPNGKREPQSFNVIENQLDFQVTPTEVGNYKVEIEFDGKLVGVVVAPIDQGLKLVDSRVTAKPFIDKATLSLPITTSDGSLLTNRNVKAFLLTPAGKKQEIEGAFIGPDGALETNFVSSSAGLHSISLEVDGVLLDGCISVDVPIGIEPLKAKIERRFLNKQVCLSLPIVTTCESSLDSSKFGGNMISPTGTREHVSVSYKHGNLETTIVPSQLGDYALEFFYDGSKLDSDVTVEAVKSLDLLDSTFTPSMDKDTHSIPLPTADGSLLKSGTSKAFLRTLDGKKKPIEDAVISPDGNLETKSLPMDLADYAIDVEVDGQFVGSINVQLPTLKPLNFDLKSKFVLHDVDLALPLELSDGSPIHLDKLVAILLLPNGEKEVLKIQFIDSKYQTSLKPSQLGDHSIKLSYLEKEVDCKIHLQVVPEVRILEASQKTSLDLDSNLLSVPISTSDGSLLSGSKIQAFVRTPLGKRVPLPSASIDTDGNLNAPFQPDEPGLYQIEIESDGNLLAGSVQFRVPSRSSSSLKPISAEFKDQILNQNSILEFPLQSSDGSVVDPTKVSVSAIPPSGNKYLIEPVTVTSSSLLQVPWVPKEIGVHHLEVTYDNSIVSNDISIKVVPDIKIDSMHSQKHLPSTNVLSIPMNTADGGPLEGRNVRAYVLSPLGKRTPVPVGPNGIETQLDPQGESGEHQLHIEIDGHPLDPITIVVSPPRFGLRPIDPPLKLFGIKNTELKLSIPLETLDGSPIDPSEVSASLGSLPLIQNINESKFETTFLPDSLGESNLDIQYQGVKLEGEIKVTILPQLESINQKFDCTSNIPSTLLVQLTSTDSHDLHDIQPDLINVVLSQKNIPFKFDSEQLTIPISLPDEGDFPLTITYGGYPIRGKILIKSKAAEKKKIPQIKIKPVRLEWYTDKPLLFEFPVQVDPTSSSDDPFLLSPGQVKLFSLSSKNEKEELKFDIDSNTIRGSVSFKLPGDYTILILINDYDVAAIPVIHQVPVAVPQIVTEKSKTTLGFLRIAIEETTKDFSADKSGTHVRLKVGDRKRIWETPVVEKKSSPQFNCTFDCVLTEKHNLPLTLNFRVNGKSQTIGTASTPLPADFDKASFVLPIMKESKKLGDLKVSVQWLKRFHIGGPGELSWVGEKQWCKSNEASPNFRWEECGWDLKFDCDRHGHVFGSNRNTGDQWIKHNTGTFLDGKINVDVNIENGQKNHYGGSVEGDSAQVKITIEKTATGAREERGDWRLARGKVFMDFQHPKDLEELERVGKKRDEAAPKSTSHMNVRSLTKKVSHSRLVPNLQNEVSGKDKSDKTEGKSARRASQSPDPGLAAPKKDKKFLRRLSGKKDPETK